MAKSKSKGKSSSLTFAVQQRPDHELTAPLVPPSDRAWLEGSCAECVFYLLAPGGRIGMCRRRAHYCGRRPEDTCGEFEAK